MLASGTLLEQWSWRSVFALKAVLAVVAVAGTLRSVPESADPDAPRLDVGGALVAVARLVALVYSVIDASDAGWLAAPNSGGMACGAGVLVGFVRFELGQVAPMLDARLFRNRAFAAGSLPILVQLSGFVFLSLQYLQIVRGGSALLAAVSVLPMAAAMMLIAAALVALLRLGTGLSYWLLVAELLLLGIGMGVATTSATTANASALPQSPQGGSAAAATCT